MLYNEWNVYVNRLVFMSQITTIIEKLLFLLLILVTPYDYPSLMEGESNGIILLLLN